MFSHFTSFRFSFFSDSQFCRSADLVHAERGRFAANAAVGKIRADAQAGDGGAVSGALNEGRVCGDFHFVVGVSQVMIV